MWGFCLVNATKSRQIHVTLLRQTMRARLLSKTTNEDKTKDKDLKVSQTVPIFAYIFHKII